MSRLPHAGNYRDLVVYRKSRQLSKDVYDLTKIFPKEEMYSLHWLMCANDYQYISKREESPQYFTNGNPT